METGRYILRTLGCKANLYDSQLIESELQKRGWKPLAGEQDHGGDPLLCIVNSCTVTDEADLQSRKLASRLGRDNPRARVVITGCAAEIDPERLAGTRGVHYVVGNRDKPALVEMILRKFDEEAPAAGEAEVLGSARGFEQMISQHPMDREWPAPETVFEAPDVALRGDAAKTRAFLKIQEGCNAFCTYCVIPYGRGPSRSLRPREVVEQVRQLVAAGAREVVLTGTNIGDYGADWDATAAAGEPFAELVALILAETGLERLRLSSLDPVEITPSLLRLMETEPRLCPHFHVSLQNISSHILKRMKRKYTAGQAESALERIAALRPAAAAPGGVYVGMDVITGFPGETDAIFEESYALLARLPWTRLHVFPYSERAGTPATRLPEAVPQHVRIERARKLNALSLERQRAWHERALEDVRARGGKLEGVFFERGRQKISDGSRLQAGYAPGYVRVLLDEETPAAGGEPIAVEPYSLYIDPQNGDVAFRGRLQAETR